MEIPGAPGAARTSAVTRCRTASLSGAAGDCQMLQSSDSDQVVVRIMSTALPCDAAYGTLPCAEKRISKSNRRICRDVEWLSAMLKGALWN